MPKPRSSKTPPKKPTGRPSLPDADKRDEMLRVLVTAREKEAIEVVAKRRGLSASAWLRTLALEALDAAQ